MYILKSTQLLLPLMSSFNFYVFFFYSFAVGTHLPQPTQQRRACYKEKCFPGQLLAKAAHGNGGVVASGGFQEKGRGGTVMN